MTPAIGKSETVFKELKENPPGSQRTHSFTCSLTQVHSQTVFQDVALTNTLSFTFDNRTCKTNCKLVLQVIIIHNNIKNK